MQGKEYRQVPEVKAHYALRLLQRQLWREDDLALTRDIKRTFVSRYTADPEGGIRQSMYKFRSGLWEAGSASDIRMGNYPVMYSLHKEMWKTAMSS
jgi:hypothetical protein